MGDIETAARIALRTRLSTVPELPALAIEGRPFDPVQGTPWVREKLVQISESPAANGVISHRMSWQLGLFYPNGLGTRPVAKMRSAVIDAFAPGLKLEYGNFGFVIMEAARQPIVEEPDWMQAPVAIVVQAWTVG